MDSIALKDQQLIIKNILQACKNINKLNKRGYNFLYLASGFIAHYNLEGFKDYYTDNDLKTDILMNKCFNQWNNFNPSDKDYNYYMDKKAIYNAICNSL